MASKEHPFEEGQTVWYRGGNRAYAKVLESGAAYTVDRIFSTIRNFDGGFYNYDHTVWLEENTDYEFDATSFMGTDSGLVAVAKRHNPAACNCPCHE